MRCFVNVLARAFVILLVSVYTLAISCKLNYEPLTQPDPTSENEEWMLSEVRRFEPMLEIGPFIAAFQDPPRATFAGWADCQRGGKPPWYVHFNKQWIGSLTMDTKMTNGQRGRDYMSALVAHEMCHHWVTSRRGSCYDEKGAETCAFNLVSKGKPE